QPDLPLEPHRAIVSRAIGPPDREANVASAPGGGYGRADSGPRPGRQGPRPADRGGARMAGGLTLAGGQARKATPAGTGLTPLVTLGIYGLVWWYKINRELRDFSAAQGRPFDNDPALAVLALFPGGIVIVPPFFTWVYTTHRVAGAQEMTGGTDPVNAWLVVLLAPLGSFQLISLQHARNSSGDRARGGVRAAPAVAVQDQ